MRFTGHGSAAARTCSDIFLIQYPDRLRLIIFSEPPQELAASNEIPAYRNQFTLVLVAQNSVMTYPDKAFRRNMHKEAADEFNAVQSQLFPLL